MSSRSEFQGPRGLPIITPDTVLTPDYEHAINILQLFAKADFSTVSYIVHTRQRLNSVGNSLRTIIIREGKLEPRTSLAKDHEEDMVQDYLLRKVDESGELIAGLTSDAVVISKTGAEGNKTLLTKLYIPLDDEKFSYANCRAVDFTVPPNGMVFDISNNPLQKFSQRGYLRLVQQAVSALISDPKEPITTLPPIKVVTNNIPAQELL